MVAYIANKMNPDQTAPLGAVWSVFILFAPSVYEYMQRTHFQEKNIGRIKGMAKNNMCKAYTKVEYFYNDFICILNQK